MDGPHSRSLNSDTKRRVERVRRRLQTLCDAAPRRTVQRQTSLTRGSHCRNGSATCGVCRLNEQRDRSAARDTAGAGRCPRRGTVMCVATRAGKVMGLQFKSPCTASWSLGPLGARLTRGAARGASWARRAPEGRFGSGGSGQSRRRILRRGVARLCLPCCPCHLTWCHPRPLVSLLHYRQRL